jgi:hypothetical protein
MSHILNYTQLLIGEANALAIPNIFVFSPVSSIRVLVERMNRLAANRLPVYACTLPSYAKELSW